MEHHSGSARVHQTCSATHSNLENHHNLETWKRLNTKSKQWSQVGLDYKDLTVASTQDGCEGVCDGGSGVTDGSNSCDVRALRGGISERDSIGTTTLFENSYLAHNPRPGCNSLNS